MNNLGESMDSVEQPLGSLRRRDFLTKAAAAGAVAWATPIILSRPAYAQEGGGGTPGCQPKFEIDCVTHDCEQGQKCLPGVRITVLDATCPCSDGTPIACVRIVNLTPGIVAYSDRAGCKPSDAEPDEVVSTGDWVCIDPPETIFFGNPRSGEGSIPELGDSTVITFRMAVWVGGCEDDTGDPAFECRTVNVSMVWQQDESDPDEPNCGRANPCTITDAAAADSLCQNLPAGGESPCGDCDEETP